MGIVGHCECLDVASRKQRTPPEFDSAHEKRTQSNTIRTTKKLRNTIQTQFKHNRTFRLSRVSTNSLWGCNGSPQNATVGMPFRLSLKLWNDKNDRNDTTKKSCDILWSFAISGCESCSYSVNFQSAIYLYMWKWNGNECMCICIHMRDHHSLPAKWFPLSPSLAWGGSQQQQSMGSVSAAVSGWCPVYRQYMETI